MYKKCHKYSKNKSELDPNNKYSIFNPHTKTPVKNKNNVIRGVFIDPAIKTCAIRIVDNNLNNNEITTVVQELEDFRCKDPYLATGTGYYTNCLEILKDYDDYFITSHYIVIESQFYKSIDIIRIAQHMMTYILEITKNKGNRPLLIEIEPKMKSKMFGLPRMKQRELKKACTKIGLKILRKRGENKLADWIESLEKKDDHGDTICYDDLFWRLLFEDEESERKLGFKKAKPKKKIKFLIKN